MSANKKILEAIGDCGYSYVEEPTSFIDAYAEMLNSLNAERIEALHSDINELAKDLKKEKAAHVETQRILDEYQEAFRTISLALENIVAEENNSLWGRFSRIRNSVSNFLYALVY